ncbi:MAG: tetratricopeptide repeat protein, partial [Alphaproteobacteria bacterium]|nr:tetratricopeptide repeat protein [Alphaproteobacteria bacterium]
LKQAERYFRGVDRRVTGDLRYIVADGLGWVAFARGRFGEAEKWFQARQKERRSGRAPSDEHLGPAWIAMVRNDRRGATAALNRGLRLQPKYFRLYSGLGRVALLRGRYGDAVRYTLAGIKLARFNPDLLRVLDAALTRARNPGRRVEIYRHLVRQYPEVPDFRTALGWGYLDLGQYAAARRAFSAVLRIEPGQPLARAGLARATARMYRSVSGAWKLYEEGRFEAALASFDARRRTSGSRNPAIDTGRGWSYFMLGNTKAARAAFRSALRLDPSYKLAQDGLRALRDAPRTIYLKAWDLIEVKRLGAARAQLGRVRSVLKPSEAWRIEEAEAWIAHLEGRNQQAGATFQKILQRRPKAWISRKGLGFVAIAEGQLDEGYRHIRLSLADRPKQVPSSYTIPAERLIDSGRADLALTILRIGAKHEPRAGVIALFQTKALVRQGRMGAATAQAIRGSRLNARLIHARLADTGLAPRSARRAYLELGKSLYAVRHYKGAVQRLSEYLAAGGSDPEAIRTRGFAYYRLGQFAEASRDLSRIVRYEPGRLRPVLDEVSIPGTGKTWVIRFDGRSTLAWSLLLQRKAQDADRTFAQVLQYHPGWIDALTGRGYAKLALKDRRSAARLFRRALLLSPGYPDAWQGLVRTGSIN